MSNNLFFGYMISSKFNFIVSAAILASTVYLLWIKIKRKSTTHKKNGSDSEICKNNNSEEFAKSQSKSLENYVDSNFNAQEENEIFEDKSQSLLETKCLYSIGDVQVKSYDAEINECLKEETLNSLELPLTNITTDILHEFKIDLEISNEKQEIYESITKEEILESIKLNTGDNLIEEKNHNNYEFSVTVENKINMSIEDGEIIEESIVDEIHETEIVVEKMESLLINNNSEIFSREIEDGEIVDESLLENEFKELICDNSENTINSSSEYDPTFKNDLEPQPLINNDSESISGNKLLVQEHIQLECRKKLEIEEGEIIDESFIQNEIGGSIYENNEVNKDEFEENFDTTNALNYEELQQSIQNEVLVENKSFEDKEILENIDKEILENTDKEILLENTDEILENTDREILENIDKKILHENTDEILENNDKEILENTDREILENTDKKILLENTDEILENTDKEILENTDKEILENTDKEILHENNDEIIVNTDKEILENEELCSIEIIKIGKCNENYETSIENNDVMDNKTEKAEEFIIEKEEFIDELMVNKNGNQINKEYDCFDASESSIEEVHLINSLAKNEEISNAVVDSNRLTSEYFENEIEHSKLEPTETSTNLLLKYESNNNVDSTSDLSQNSDYFDDAPLDKFMDYIEECLNGNESKNDENCKLENWPNDEDSLNSIKRDFYENSTAICSPHPSSESDHAHCVNNLTERVAILSAESILDNQQCHVTSSDSEMTPTLSSPTLDDSNPELYVEKITYDGKELDVVYFEEALLEEGGIQSDIKIVRTIPVGLGGRIIGKKGKTKNELLKKYGAQLLIYNHPDEIGKQILEITCSPSVSNQLEDWVNKTLDQISKNTIQTTVSNPEWLKPMIPLGRLVAAHVIDMTTVQYVKIRIFDQQIIKQFNKMQNEMNIDYSRADNTSLLPRPVAAGCVCVAMIRPDYFLRAQIVDIYEDYAWVYLFDLGKVCQTYLCYLFKIREKYMRVPFQVIPARMPHALIKNKNISPAIIYKRFLCDPITNKPKMVRVFFPRMNTCCEPCVNIYIPMSTVSDNSNGRNSNTNNNEEFVDLLELLVSIDVCSMVRETVNSDIQVKINTNHFKAFLNGKDKKQNINNSNVPVYFQPCNSKFYDDFIEFKPGNETN